jgi:hypothetical protein
MSPEGNTPADSEGVVEGKYANYFKVGHNAFEFIVEFAQLYSELALEKVHTRIVTSPAYAKELLKVLQEAVDAYEGVFGTIPKQE